MSSDSGFSQLGDIITNVSNFLDIESTVHLSRTCSTIHKSLTDDPLGYYPKLKVPYFDLSDPSVWRDEEGGRIAGPIPDSQTVKTLATQVIPKIHFPSVKVIYFRPPTPRLFTNDQIDLRDAFTHLAIGLQSARDLEELTIDAGVIMRHEKFNQKMVFETFSQNLANCKKLKRLKIFNQAKTRRNETETGGVSYYSLGLLLAIIPTIKARVSTLTHVTVMIGNGPIFEPPTISCRDVVRELFIEIFSLQKLIEFNVSVDLRTSPLMNECLKAAEHVLETVGVLPSSETLVRLSLGCVLYKVRKIFPMVTKPLQNHRTKLMCNLTWFCNGYQWDQPFWTNEDLCIAIGILLTFAQPRPTPFLV